MSDDSEFEQEIQKALAEPKWKRELTIAALKNGLMGLGELEPMKKAMESDPTIQGKIEDRMRRLIAALEAANAADNTPSQPPTFRMF